MAFLRKNKYPGGHIILGVRRRLISFFFQRLSQSRANLVRCYCIVVRVYIFSLRPTNIFLSVYFIYL